MSYNVIKFSQNLQSQVIPCPLKKSVVCLTAVNLVSLRGCREDIGR